MAETTAVTVTLTTFGGLRARFTFHVASSIVSPTDAVITGLITVLEAVTRGKAVHIEISLQAATVGSAATGVPYVSEDKAFMRFKDASAVGHNYKVMGPIDDIFLDDTEGVDPDNPDVGDYIAAVNTYAKGRGGNDVTAFVRGYRKENRKKIKGGTAVA